MNKKRLIRHYLERITTKHKYSQNRTYKDTMVQMKTKENSTELKLSIMGGKKILWHVDENNNELVPLNHCENLLIAYIDSLSLQIDDMKSPQMLQDVFEEYCNELEDIAIQKRNNSLLLHQKIKINQNELDVYSDKNAYYLYKENQFIFSGDIEHYDLKSTLENDFQMYPLIFEWAEQRFDSDYIWTFYENEEAYNAFVKQLSYVFSFVQIDHKKLSEIIFGKNIL